jgi:hypothetical protein
MMSVSPLTIQKFSLKIKMAATEVTFKDIQQDSREAQLYKSEFRCSNCSKLQSELKEAKLELKSLK